MSKINAVEKGISYMLSKAPTGKINPDTLGYILPNGYINFATGESAVNYAKTIILKALHSKKPYERGFLLKDRLIIADIKGKGDEINFGKLKSRGCTVIHGHPYPSPVSLPDVSYMLSHRAKEIIAFNPEGEYSKLTHIQSPKFLDSLPPKLKDFFDKCIWNFRRGCAEGDYQTFMRPIDKALLKRLRSVMENIKNFNDNLDEKTQNAFKRCISKILDYRIIESSQIPEEFRPVLNSLFEIANDEISTKIPYVHKFWQQNAKKYGLIYETNYSNL